MKFFPTRTTFVSFGNLTIQWYAICLLSGVVVAYYLSRRNLKTYKNIDVNGAFDDIFIYMLWAGFLGARLWFCLFDANYNYLANPIQIIRIWDGGMAIHGALVGGGLATYLCCKKKGISIYKLFDAVLPTVLIGQAIGRWGNFVNQECYGNIVNESYYDGILKFIKSSMYIGGEYREPMFLYESLLCLLGFFLINFLLRKIQNKRGDLGWAYLMWYGTIRFFIEGHRQDSLMIKFLNLRTAQVISISFVLIGILGYVGVIDKFIKNKKPTLIFDLDGTLIDSKPIIVKCYSELFKKHDDINNFTRQRQAEVLGPALKDMFPIYFPNENVDELLKEYRENFVKYQDEYVKPMPNAKEVLDDLTNKGYDIGIVTTRDTNSTKDCLKIAGLDSYIKDIVGLNDVKKTKPDIEAYDLIINRNGFNKADLVVIGDSPADVKGGFNYGAYTVALNSEPDKEEVLIASNPNVVISDLKELPEILNKKQYFTYNLK